jgi:hypothetical protein
MYRICIAIIVLYLLLVVPLSAQLNTIFDTIFDTILREGFILSPGEHGEHFFPAADLSSEALAPALNTLIVSNISTFPLSSTVPGVGFDFSTGRPVSVRESLGPVFGETAETLGEGRMVLGFNATHLNLNRFRGIPTDQMQFTFTHEDVEEPGLGDSPNESDILHLNLGLKPRAYIFAFFGTYGIANNFDVSIAIPFVQVTLEGEAHAVIESFTLAALGTANHYFGGDSLNPILDKSVPYSGQANGIGDIAMRFKYRLPFITNIGMAVLADIRIPTGNENNFLGTASMNVRLTMITSRRFGDFTPHINVGYEFRGSARESDKIVLTGGFDQKIVTGITLSAGFFGLFDLDSDKTIELFPGVVTITDRSPITGATHTRYIPLSNVPDRTFDHIMNFSFGMRLALWERFQLVNVLVPVNEGGLRSGVVPTLGYSLSW